METEPVSSLAGKVLEALWPWKTGPGASVYQLLTGAGLSSLSGLTYGAQSREVGLSLVGSADYLAGVVKRSMESMKFLHGKNLPLDVNVTTQKLSQSLQYGLMRVDHTLQLKGDKRYMDEFLERLRTSIVIDQREPRLDSPQVISQFPEGWLTTGSPPGLASGTIPVESSSSSTALGITALLLGVIASLFLLSRRLPGNNSVNALQAAVTHLEKRGLQDPQLLGEEPVEGGEKFYFQTPTENYTVVVDKNGRVFSWSRVPFNPGGPGR